MCFTFLFISSSQSENVWYDKAVQYDIWFNYDIDFNFQLEQNDILNRKIENLNFSRKLFVMR